MTRWVRARVACFRRFRVGADPVEAGVVARASSTKGIRMDSFDKSHRSDHVQRDYRSNRGADQAAGFDDPRADRVHRCHAERPGACIPGRCLPMLRKAVSGSGEHRAGPGGQGGFSRPIAAHRETRHRLLDLRA
jgi:hypothetical protein